MGGVGCLRVVMIRRVVGIRGRWERGGLKKLRVILELMLDYIYMEQELWWLVWGP
jgi:hypothetical protein